MFYQGSVKLSVHVYEPSVAAAGTATFNTTHEVVIVQTWLTAEAFIIMVHGVAPIDVIVVVLVPGVHAPLLKTLVVACIETPVAGMIVVPLVTVDDSNKFMFQVDSHWVSVHTNDCRFQVAVNALKVAGYCPITQDVP